MCENHCLDIDTVSFSFLFLANQPDPRYDFQTSNPTISKLVHPADNRRPGSESNYQSARTNPADRDRQTGYDRYPTNAGDTRPEFSDRNNSVQYARRVPTADVFVDPIRRPHHGNARTCVMEINIAVSLGNDRSSREPFVTSSVTSKPPVIRSTATLEDVHYVDLNFRSPENVAQLSTDGLIRRSPSEKSTGFPPERQWDTHILEDFDQNCIDRTENKISILNWISERKSFQARLLQRYSFVLTYLKLSLIFDVDLPTSCIISYHFDAERKIVRHYLWSAVLYSHRHRCRSFVAFF